MTIKWRTSPHWANGKRKGVFLSEGQDEADNDRPIGVIYDEEEGQRIARGFNSSGHYCDGMTEAFTQNQQDGQTISNLLKALMEIRDYERCVSADPRNHMAWSMYREVWGHWPRVPSETVKIALDGMVK